MEDGGKADQRAYAACILKDRGVSLRLKKAVKIKVEALKLECHLT